MLNENRENEDNTQGDNTGSGGEAAIEMLDTPAKRKIIKDAADDIVELRKQRKALNDKINEQLSNVEAQGVNKKAFKAALKRMELTEADRLVEDTSYAFCCMALNIGHQTDMFDESPDSDTTH